MGAERRKVSSSRTDGGEAVDNRRRLMQPEVVANPAQPGTTNPTWPRVIADPAQPGIANLTRARVVINPAQPRAANVS
jgi:hypothetical protein